MKSRLRKELRRRPPRSSDKGLQELLSKNTCLEGSFAEGTDSFALVLKAMKKIIMRSPVYDPAREFLLHSSKVTDAIGRSDPDLQMSLPKFTLVAVLSFSKDPEGKQHLLTG